MQSLDRTIQEIKADLPVSGAPLKTLLASYLFSARFRVLLNHRLGKYFFYNGSFILRLISIYYRYRLVTKRNCDISYKASIGKNLNLPHPLGIVIGDGVVIKDNVMVFQQVTFGSHGKNAEEMQYPVIENNVRIYAGAKIIGGITIGENSVIGANSVVNIDIPPNSVAYGIPCRIKEKR